MKRLSLAVLAALSVVVLAAIRLAPAPARAVATTSDRRPSPVRGAFHVHSRDSDGTGTVEEIAAAAARAGLNFVILTDHGDATREPTPPVYHGDVLVIGAVEISTDGGHVVALGISRAPYPLAGEPRDVVDDVARLGGMSIAAHPGSAKTELRWRDWTTPVDGLEWLNGDSQWRDEPAASLVRAILTYPVRRAESLATLLDRPEAELAQWDALTRRRRIVALAAGDAHARLGFPGGGEPYDGRALFRIPGYEQVFRTLSIGLPGIVLTRDAPADARAVVDAIRKGRVYSSIDALATPASLAFTAHADAGQVAMGDETAAGGRITFRVETGGPPDARITLLKHGVPVASAQGTALEQISEGEPGAYRVEVHLPDEPGEPPVPWIVSNPIYIRAAEAVTPMTDLPATFTSTFSVYENGPAGDWRVEHSARSEGALDVVPTIDGSQLRLRYALGGTLSESPFVALAMPAGPGIGRYERLQFTARALQPMRISVQVRVPDGGAGERWHRSVYLDEVPREITIAFGDMTPRGRTGSARPVTPDIRDVLFVVDTVNTRPGSSGQIWIDDVRYVR